MKSPPPPAALSGTGEAEVPWGHGGRGDRKTTEVHGNQKEAGWTVSFLQEQGQPGPRGRPTHLQPGLTPDLTPDPAGRGRISTDQP